MLATIAREAEEIKRLEQELREGQCCGLHINLGNYQRNTQKK